MAEKLPWSERIRQLRAARNILETDPPHLQVKRVRECLGWTQRQLADKLSELSQKTETDPEENPSKKITSTITISRWERQERIPEEDYRRKLQRLLGIPIYAWPPDEEQEKNDSAHLAAPPLQATTPQEKLSAPIWHVPYAPNPYFTDQRDLVQTLRERFTANEVGAAHQAISGLGGIGKTQLALAYAYQYRETYEAVLWAGASTEAQLLGDLAAIAALLQVPETRKAKPQQQYLVNEVLHWLRAHSGWLLILDNVEDYTSGIDKDLQLDQLFALRDHGHILLTTRIQSIARRAQNFPVGPMEPEEGVQLLLSRDGQPSSLHLLKRVDEHEFKEAYVLARLLDGLPLALEQARAYIESTECGFAGYRQLYEEARKELLQTVPEGSRLEKEYERSVATTWLISFHQVKQRSRAAADLLNLYAFLAPDAIPEKIVLHGAEKIDGEIRQLAGNTLQFNRVCQILLNYSLIKRNGEKSILFVHRLVQAVIQDRLTEEQQYFWAEQAVRAVEHTFLSATDQEVEQYIPHAQTCAMFIERYHLAGQDVAFLLKMAAKAVDERGWFAQAQPLYLQAFNAFLHAFGAEDPRTIHLLFDVLHISQDMGASIFAADVYKKIIADVEHILGPEDPNRLVLLNNIVWMQIHAGDYNGAAQAGMQAMQLLHRLPNIDPINRAKTYQVTAELAILLGRVDLAEIYYQEATALFEQTLGHEHREVANTLANMGAFYARCGNLAQAEILLRQALEIRQHLFGDDHPEIADALVFLASISWQTRRYHEAEAYYHRALAIRQPKLGPSHPQVLQTLRSLAQLAAAQDKDEEAERYFQEAFALASPVKETIAQEFQTLQEAYADFQHKRGHMD